MFIGNATSFRNNQRRIAALLITVMTHISLWKCICTTNRFVGALSKPKVLVYRQTPNLYKPSCTVVALQSKQLRSISRSCKVPMMMSIVDDVTAEMKVAMKAKDSVTLGTIRLIRTAFANAAIELRTESLNDEQALMALRKLAKMRKESIEMYESNGASDRADVERAELAVIEQYLPAAVSDDVVREWAKEAIAEAGAIDNVGKVMGAFMKKHKSDVDGTIAQRIVKEEIEKMKQA